MTTAEIEDQIDLWASAAERAYKAGFDAVEINHGTCHQGNTFLSRVWNRRDDEYGPQSLENRTRFLRDIIAETKRRCGPGFAVHALINVAEYNHPLATTLDEGAEMAVLIGEVADGINCRAERYGHRGGLLQPDRLFYPEPPVDLPADLDWSRRGEGATVPLTEACKRAGVTVPVWTACRLDPDLGEEYLRRGSLDFVGMTRRLLADPDCPNKVMEGRAEDIRPCTGCLHCFDMRNRNKKLECRVNATLGRETDPGVPARPGRDAQEGAGRRGRPCRDGGRPRRRPARPPGRAVREGRPPRRAGARWRPSSRTCETQEFVDFVAYLEAQLEKKHVAVRTRQPVTPELVRAAQAGCARHRRRRRAHRVRRPWRRRRQGRPDARSCTACSRRRSGSSRRRRSRPAAERLDAGRQERRHHGRHAARLRARRVPDEEGHDGSVAHDGPAAELGDGMTVDDLENLWPWLKQKDVTVWAPVEYLEVVEDGLKVRVPDKRTYVLEGRHVMQHAGLGAQHGDRRGAFAAGRRDARGRQRPGPRAHRGRRPRRRPAGYAI